MNILSNVTVSGFWDSQTIAIPFHADVNFLIGPNGSGKTNIINMVAAALNADFLTLDRLPFEKINLQLSEIGGTKKPSIEIEKKGKSNLPFSSISYKIKEKASGEIASYSLDDLEEQLTFRDYPLRYNSEILSRRSNIVNANIIEKLKRIVNVSWLSIHRAESSRSIREDRGSYESTVDKKLDELSNELLKYFSLLEKKGNSETSDFQKTVFLSLIPSQTENELFSAIKQLELSKEKEALIDIFHKFSVEDNKFSKILEEHFKLLKKAANSLETGAGIDQKQLISIVSAFRINSVVQKWNNLLDLQKKIYEPRETFLEIINGMLQRKNLKINEKNELIVKTSSNEILSIKQLSSGEKQLLIILGSALLQEKSPWIYIADEPELSLHIDWQEKLITNLRRINPKAQIIFATHSPDIVSVYGDRVFDMEKILA
jgi:predicted ATPase